MCKVRVKTSRKDSEPAISKALQKALGEDLAEVSFERAIKGKGKEGIVAEVFCPGEDCDKIMAVAKRALDTVSRGRSVLIYSIRYPNAA